MAFPRLPLLPLINRCLSLSGANKSWSVEIRHQEGLLYLIFPLVHVTNEYRAITASGLGGIHKCLTFCVFPNWFRLALTVV